jgi:hypothetical protein
MVLVAVGESLYVHYFFKTNRPALAVNLDQVLVKAIILGLYPITTVSTALWGLDQFTLCPNSELCGAPASSGAFKNRDQHILVIAVLVGVGGNLFVFYASGVYLNRRMTEHVCAFEPAVPTASTPPNAVGDAAWASLLAWLAAHCSSLRAPPRRLRLNKKRAAVRVMLSLTDEGFAPEEEVALDDLASPSVKTAMNESLSRTKSGRMGLANLNHLGVSTPIAKMPGSFVSSGKEIAKGKVRDTLTAVGLRRESLAQKRKRKKSDSMHIDADYDTFVEAVDESFDYFDLDDGGTQPP